MQNVVDIPLQFSVLQIDIQAVEDMTLPAYPAITLRGGLGYALRKLECRCQSVEHTETCLYAALYEEKNGVTIEGGYIPYTRPFLIRTGFNYKKVYRQQEHYTFELVLFGDAIAHYQSFVLAFQQFGKQGIGEQRIPFQVVEVRSETMASPIIVYEQGRLYSQPYRLSYTNLLPTSLPEIAQMKLVLTTPTRLKLQGQQQYSADLPLIIESLLRRLKSLLYFHQGILLDEDIILQYLDYAIESKTVLESFYYVHYDRYSTRQKQQMRLDGIEGELIAQQVHEDLLALLYVGQYIHIGKQTVFGLGAYEMKFYLNI